MHLCGGKKCSATVWLRDGNLVSTPVRAVKKPQTAKRFQALHRRRMVRLRHRVTGCVASQSRFVRRTQPFVLWKHGPIAPILLASLRYRPSSGAASAGSASESRMTRCRTQRSANDSHEWSRRISDSVAYYVLARCILQQCCPAFIPKRSYWYLPSVGLSPPPNSGRVGWTAHSREKPFAILLRWNRQALYQNAVQPGFMRKEKK